MKSTFRYVVANLASLTIDEIKNLIEPHLRCMVVQSFVLQPGTFLYRARMLSDSFQKSDGVKLRDLIYPPTPKARQGRVNREGNPVFYSSLAKEAPFFEFSNIVAGSELVISLWKTTEPMYLNNVGYTQAVFERLGARRPVPIVNSQSGDRGKETTISLPAVSGVELHKILSADTNHELRNLLGQHFAREIGDSEAHLYKLTTAIGELHLGKLEGGTLKFAGVLYPAMKMWANADNVAVLPWFVDNHLELRKVIHVRVDSHSGTSMSITTLDHARGFDIRGNLRWAGRDMNWTVTFPPKGSATTVATEGRDPDGDYDRSPNGDPVHWVLFDSEGKTIDPS